MDEQIKHRTERLPGVFRNEIYELNDMRYIEQFDDMTGKRMCGYIEMYGGVRVCLVGENGVLSTNIPTGWITCRKEMKLFQSDIEKLDKFLCEICKKYDKF